MRRVSISLAVVTLLACGSDSGECTIRPSGQPGIRLLQCPTGTVQIAGGDGEATCSLVSEKEGWRRVHCSDGTTVLIDPEGNVHYPGSGAIQGLATLAGAEGDHDGIVVRAEGTPFETRTDKEGQFVLGGLPAGLYRVVIEHPGRVPEVRTNVPVVNGTYSLGNIQLSIGLRLSENRDATVIPSPSSDSVLVVEATNHGNLLSLVHLETWERTHLSSNAHEPSYRFDGRKVLWTENLTSRSKVYVYDVDTGEREMLPVEGLGAVFFADGRAVLVRQEAEAVHRLAVHDTLEGETIPLGTWSPSFLSQLPMGPDGGSVVYGTTSQVLLYDHENRETVSLGGTGVSFHEVLYHPSGRLVAVPRQEGPDMRSLILVDLSRGTTEILEPKLMGGVVQHPGDGSLLWRGEDGYRLWDGELRETIRLPLPDVSGIPPSFLPDGSGVLFVGPSEVWLWKRGESQADRLASQYVTFPRITPDGEHVLIEVIENGLMTMVVGVRDGSVELLEEHGWFLGESSGFLFRQNGDRLFFYDFERAEVGPIEASTFEFGFGEGDVLLFRGRRADGIGETRIGMWEGATRDIRWLLPGRDPVLSRNGRYLFYRACLPAEGAATCNHLFRYDLVTSDTDWVVGDADMPRPDELGERYLLFRVNEGDEQGLYLARAER